MTLPDADIYARITNDGGLGITTDASPEDKAESILEAPQAMIEQYGSLEELIHDFDDWAILRDRQPNGHIRCHTLCPAPHVNNIERHPSDGLLRVTPQESVALGGHRNLGSRYFNELEIAPRERLLNRLSFQPSVAEPNDVGADWYYGTDSLNRPFYIDDRLVTGNDDAEWVVTYNARSDGHNGTHGDPTNHQIFVPIDDLEFESCAYGWGLNLPDSARMYWDGPSNVGDYQMTVSHMFVCDERIVPPEGDT